MEPAGKHLWEYEHPHYSSDNNYFNKDVGKTYSSWQDFMAQEGKEMEAFCGLVYRWDWEEKDVQDILLLFCINQRKGIYVPLRVMVEKADEPEVVKWLRPRAKDLALLWSPIAGDLQPNRAHEWEPGEPIERDPRDKVGQCEFCESDDVTVRSYENRKQPECQRQPRKWLCALCACTHASIAHDYGSDHEGVLKTLCYVANSVMGDVGEEPTPSEISRFRRLLDRLNQHLTVDEVHQA